MFDVDFWKHTSLQINDILSTHRDPDK